jgi:hypothetical protein
MLLAAGSADLVEQQAAVGQAGQRIVEGQLPGFSCKRFWLLISTWVPT